MLAPAATPTWLLPRPANGTERPAVGDHAESETAVRAVVHDVITARAEGPLEKELRQSLAEGTPDAEVQARRMQRVTELALGPRHTPRDSSVAPCPRTGT